MVIKEKFQMEYIIPIGADIKREGTDVTIVSFEKIIKKLIKLLRN
jgi:pyruvate/2-oxoglutarate/acetoin dehydrogenase E1 component